VDTRGFFASLLLPLLVLQGLIAGCSFSFEDSSTPTSTFDAPPSSQASTMFHSPEYGFSVPLPAGWEGYLIRNSNWEGLGQSGDQGDVVVQVGPMISIGHPASTEEHPRQDIPIMVFTVQQWDSMLAGEWHVGAAPIAPLELGRNSRYVFALPARYNYAFLEGWEEVEQILRSHPLVTFEPAVGP